MASVRICENEMCQKEMEIKSESSKKRLCLACQSRKRNFDTYDPVLALAYEEHSKKLYKMCFESDKKQFYYIGEMSENRLWFGHYLDTYIYPIDIRKLLVSNHCDFCFRQRDIYDVDLVPKKKSRKSQRQTEAETAEKKEKRSLLSIDWNYVIHRKNPALPHFLLNCRIMCPRCCIENEKSCMVNCVGESVSQQTFDVQLFLEQPDLKKSQMKCIFLYICFSQSVVFEKQEIFFRQLFDSFVFKSDFERIFGEFDTKRVYFSENRMMYKNGVVGCGKDYTFTKIHFALVYSISIREINLSAFRPLTYADIHEFRSQFFAEQDPITFFSCQLCGTWIFDYCAETGTNTSYVDHDYTDPNFTFVALVESFLESEFTSESEILNRQCMVMIDTDTFYLRLKSFDTETKFKEYHKRHAKLRMLCYACNRYQPSTHKKLSVE
jgi:hypothetical protein